MFWIKFIYREKLKTTIYENYVNCFRGLTRCNNSCPNDVTKIIKKNVGRNTGIFNRSQNLNFQASEHVFHGLIRKFIKKEVYSKWNITSFEKLVHICQRPHQCLHLLLLHLLLHNILLLTLLTKLWSGLQLIKVSLKYTCFSRNSLTWFF